MKRILCLAAALAMVLVGAVLGWHPAASAEGSFSQLVGSYYLASGVGAWHTELHLSADGSFEGHYIDMDMGDVGELEGVPYQGTQYVCAFTGQLSGLTQAGGTELDAKVAQLDWEQGDPYVEDGVLCVPTRPGGISKGAELRFFLKGTDVAELPEAFLVWVRMREVQIDWTELPDNSFYNVTDDAGFSGQALPRETAAPTAAPAAQGELGGFFYIPAPESGEDGAEGLKFPVEAKVVNCQSFVTLRATPSTKAQALAEVPLGAVVRVQSNAAYYGNDRCFVEAEYDGKTGYVCLDYLDVILPQSLSFQTGYLHSCEGTVSAVNPGTDLLMRVGPGMDNEIFGLLFGGEVLGYLGDARKDAAGTCWYHCSYYGEACWISAKYTVLTLNDGTTYTGSRGIY